MGDKKSGMARSIWNGAKWWVHNLSPLASRRAELYSKAKDADIQKNRKRVDEEIRAREAQKKPKPVS